MNKHWTSGDSEGMAKLMNDMNDESPAMYKTLLTDRNANWAEWIDKRLDKPGVVFMGVGAGHLGGKDSVQDLLAKRGIKSARIANQLRDESAFSLEERPVADAIGCSTRREKFASRCFR